MKQELLIKLQDFFEKDVEIKKLMLEMAPPNNDEFLDDHSLSKYAINFLKTFDYIHKDLNDMTHKFLGGEKILLSKLDGLKKTVYNRTLAGATNIHQLRDNYYSLISYMDPEFVEHVKNECVAYSLFNYPVKSILGAQTVNEYLHLFHSLVLNSDIMLQQIAPVDHKENDMKETIVLRGEVGPEFRQVFDDFPLDLDVGPTDMIGINENKLLMMVRDRGHALTMEIDLEEDQARMEYFVPKICDIEMVNALPGITKVNENSIGARGITSFPKEELSEQIFGFISKVPTDLDLMRNMNL